MNVIDMRSAFASTATELLDQDDSVAVVLADISEQLFEPAARRHPPRPPPSCAHGSTQWATR